MLSSCWSRSAFAIVATLTLRGALRHLAARAAVSLLTVGYYYVVVSGWHLTQIESVVGGALFLALASALAGGEGGHVSRRHCFLAGAAGGCVLVMKVVLLPLVAALWGVGLLRLARSPERSDTRSLVEMPSILACGAAVPITITLVVLARQDVLREALWTWFVFPVDALQRRADWNRVYFADSLRWILTQWTPLLGLALIGIPRALQERTRWLGFGLLVWIGAGLLCIVLQSLSGWQYHFMLILPPVGLLAAFGLDALIDGYETWLPFRAARWRGLVAIVPLALLSLAPLQTLARKVVRLARHDWALTTAGRWGFQVEMSRGNEYGAYGATSGFLAEPGARPGPIYVLGSPIVYWVSGRRPAVARTGGTIMDQLTAEDWRDLARSLAEGPTIYVFVGAGGPSFLEVLRPASDPMLEVLRGRFRLVRSDPYGAWYEKR